MADDTVSAASPQPARRAQPLLQSVDFLQALLEGTPHSVYFKDQASRFILVSRSLARLLGLAEPQQAFGKTDGDFFSAEHADQALADERRIMETGEPVVDLVEKETWPDGRVTWASSTKLPLRDAAGRIVGTFGISRDITARKIAEQRLAEAQRALVEASRKAAVTEFASGVFSGALDLVEAARGKAERIRRRASCSAAEATSQLAGRLADQLTNGTGEHQLAVNLCALTATAAADRRALDEELEELHRDLEQIARILALPK